MTRMEYLPTVLATEIQPLTSVLERSTNSSGLLLRSQSRAASWHCERTAPGGRISVASTVPFDTSAPAWRAYVAMLVMTISAEVWNSWKVKFTKAVSVLQWYSSVLKYAALILQYFLFAWNVAQKQDNRRKALSSVLQNTF